MYRYTINLGVNTCINIHTYYNPFSFNYKNDLYYYGSTNRRKLKHKYNLDGIVQDHHIIPKSFEKHKLISETKFPIHCSKNIKMMPSISNKNITEDILVHTNHYKYNLFVKDKLDEIYETKINIEERKINLIDLIHELNIKLNHRNNIPWN
jgi:A nuclease family of the HNH/ENDO VII superfamily with conserved AHH